MKYFLMSLKVAGVWLFVSVFLLGLYSVPVVYRIQFSNGLECFSLSHESADNKTAWISPTNTKH